MVAGISSVSMQATSPAAERLVATAKARRALIRSGWARTRKASASSASVCEL